MKKHGEIIFGVIGIIALFYCIYEMISGLFDLTDTMRGLRLMIGGLIFYISMNESKNYEK